MTNIRFFGVSVKKIVICFGFLLLVVGVTVTSVLNDRRSASKASHSISNWSQFNSLNLNQLEALLAAQRIAPIVANVTTFNGKTTKLHFTIINVMSTEDSPTIVYPTLNLITSGKVDLTEENRLISQNLILTQKLMLNTPF
jgi:hypothetical protein